MLSERIYYRFCTGNHLGETLRHFSDFVFPSIVQFYIKVSFSEFLSYIGNPLQRLQRLPDSKEVHDLYHYE